MSKKRTSTESSHDEQTTKDSGGELMQAVFQNEEDNPKRAKLASLSDTTLDDLPMELIEGILLKAVAMEVKSMKLDKSVRKQKADLVISRLRTVSLQWSSILSTDFFRNELHRILDGFAQETMTLHWEIQVQPSSELFAIDMTTMRDEVFMLRGRHGEGYALDVYGRNDMMKPKDIIALPEINPEQSLIAACIVSNCVYLLNANSLGPSVYRVAREEHQFKVSLWIKNLRLSMTEMGTTGLSVSANGNVIICSGLPSPKLTVVGIYGANGVVQHKIRLSPATYGFRYVSSVIQKADGNLIVVSSDSISAAKLLEIDTSGSVIRQYQSEHIGRGLVKCFEDICGRILVYYSDLRLELLDSEFHLLDTATPDPSSVPKEGEPVYLYNVQYSSDRHEMVAIRCDWRTNTSAFASLRFTDE